MNNGVSDVSGASKAPEVSDSSSPVFIVGCDRSGTTLLRLMLIQNPTLHIPTESGFIPVLRESRKDYGDFTGAAQRFFFLRDLQRTQATSKTVAFDIFNLTIPEAEEALSQAAPTDYPGGVAALFQACARKEGKTRWGDKTPRYVTELPWLCEVFPGARFVQMLRDPRDVTTSIINAGWASSYREAARHWVRLVDAGRRAGHELGDDVYRELRYEDLLNDPETSMRDLCSWLNLEFTQDMFRFYEDSERHIAKNHAELFPLAKGPLDPSRAGAWRRQLRSRDVAEIEDVAGPLMADVGYVPRGLRIPFWVKGTRHIMGRLRRQVRSASSRLSRFETNDD